MSMKNSHDTVGNRTRDLPACSAVHQPTAPPRAPPYMVVLLKSTRHLNPISRRPPPKKRPAFFLSLLTWFYVDFGKARVISCVSAIQFHWQVEQLCPVYKEIFRTEFVAMIFSPNSTTSQKLGRSNGPAVTKIQNKKNDNQSTNWATPIYNGRLWKYQNIRERFWDFKFYFIYALSTMNAY